MGWPRCARPPRVMSSVRSAPNTVVRRRSERSERSKRAQKRDAPTRILITSSSSSLRVRLSSSWNTLSLRCVAIFVPCSNSSRIEQLTSPSSPQPSPFSIGSVEEAGIPRSVGLTSLACATLILRVTNQTDTVCVCVDRRRRPNFKFGVNSHQFLNDDENRLKSPSGTEPRRHWAVFVL